MAFNELDPLPSSQASRDMTTIVSCPVDLLNADYLCCIVFGESCVPTAASDYQCHFFQVPVKVYTERDVRREVDAAKAGLEHRSDWQQWVGAMRRLAGVALGGAAEEFPALFVGLVRARVQEMVGHKVSLCDGIGYRYVDVLTCPVCAQEGGRRALMHGSWRAFVGAKPQR